MLFHHRILCALSHLGIDASDHCHGYAEHNVFTKQEDKEKEEETLFLTAPTPGPASAPAVSTPSVQEEIPTSPITPNDGEDRNNENENDETNSGGNENDNTENDANSNGNENDNDNAEEEEENHTNNYITENDHTDSDNTTTSHPPTDVVIEDQVRPYCAIDNSDGVDNNNNNNVPQLHFGNPSYTTSTTIEYMYQVQGTLQLSSQVLRENVLPQLDVNIANLLLPLLFAPDFCIPLLGNNQYSPESLALQSTMAFAATSPSSSQQPPPPQQQQQQQQQQHAHSIISVGNFHAIPSTSLAEEEASDGDGDGGRRHYDRHLLDFSDYNSNNSSSSSSSSSNKTSLFGVMTGAAGGNGSRVTGMSALPLDQIMPGYAGVQCRSTLVPGAARCFIVKGAITLTGNKNENDDSNLDWAVPLVRSILQQYSHEDFKILETVSSLSSSSSSSSSSSWFLQHQPQQQQEQVDAMRAEMQAQVHGLAAPFPNVMDIRFLNLQQELENGQPPLPPVPAFDGNVSTSNPSTTSGNRGDDVGIFSDGDKIYAVSSWTWVVVSFAAIFVIIYALFLCKRRVCACCKSSSRNGRHASHYRLENGNGDDDHELGEAVLAHTVSRDHLSPSSSGGGGGGGGGFRSWRRRCPSWTRSLDESLEGSSHHLELDEGGGIYHHVHHSHHDVTGEPPVVVQQEVMQQMEQASLISGTFVEASVTSIASGSFHDMLQHNNRSLENTVIVVDDAGIVGNNDSNGNAYVNHRQTTIDVLDDIASSLSADDDAGHFTIFPQPLSIPTSSSPSSNSNNNINNNMNNLNDLHHFETDFDNPMQPYLPDLEANNIIDNNHHLMITASNTDDGENNIVLHYHDPDDPTRPPIDLNNIVNDLEQLANSPHPADDADGMNVSIDDEAAESDLTSSASSDGGSGDKNNSHSSGSSRSNSGNWKAMIV